MKKFIICFFATILLLNSSYSKAESVCPNAEDKDLTKLFLTKDFSSVLMPGYKFLGYIGNNFQRLYVDFTSIKKDAKNPAIYHVKGFTKVKNNQQNFEGEIKVQAICGSYYDFTNYKSYGDDEMDDLFANDAKASGTLYAEYNFKENPAEPYSGRFSGFMNLFWLTTGGKEKLSHFSEASDSNCNNQYQGKWTSYKTKISKRANWGELRIPQSQPSEGYDLDYGAGEFGPNEKYKKQGWDKVYDQF